jgi:hypothetical protein
MCITTYYILEYGVHFSHNALFFHFSDKLFFAVWKKAMFHVHRAALVASVAAVVGLLCCVVFQQTRYFENPWRKPLSPDHNEIASRICYDAVAMEVAASPGLAASLWEAHYPAGTFGNTVVSVSVNVSCGTGVHDMANAFRSATRAFWLVADPSFTTWVTFASAGALPYRTGSVALRLDGQKDGPLQPRRIDAWARKGDCGPSCPCSTCRCGFALTILCR